MVVLFSHGEESESVRLYKANLSPEGRTLRKPLLAPSPLSPHSSAGQTFKLKNNFMSSAQPDILHSAHSQITENLNKK